ncbi:DUF1285 domain-containing protein [Alteromonas flava]|uniref:DUF1285 domain-containing protein n=1 Tax=Alteromonas flava TaxID=2048003 RepID=UPI000C289D25|nr:DUF1285 domain-containing protein [Alteromonas flava]
MDLNRLAASIGGASEQNQLPPVEQWDPDFCGDIAITITRSGQWFYQGSPFGRKRLVKLFASILKRENDEYFLVTPVEKVRIEVEDVPFVITEWEHNADQIIVKTQTEDICAISYEHPVELRFDAQSETQIPYVNIRRNLWARIHQNVFYQWVEQAQITEADDGTSSVELQSGDYRFSIGQI